MFLKDWIQNSFIAYAVFSISLLPSVQLLRLQEHSVVRRDQTQHNCDVNFNNQAMFTDATCMGTNRKVYKCVHKSCQQNFQFLCRDVGPDGKSLTGNLRPIVPDDYTTKDHFIEAYVNYRLYGCPYIPENSHRQSCNNCFVDHDGD
ncbi:hypothetical protein PGTUg99_027161 [Puccinia graminis f. sp. tritici]|uniref:Uncharacterized protein n=1 Tax=Puccinia graminis f. sp. tritici TaxID=56615 RepID=A0A5B0RFX0_PUCGR|nr:hypothetical protein PGTUg99_027161 [Puccinia graminis f. sp. tritici]